jgi:hypothetical protein
MGDSEQPGHEAIQRAVNEFAQELTKQIQPAVRAATKLLQALANDPVVRFAMEHPELLRPAEPERACHCLCGAAHREAKGICTGDATAVLTRWVPSTGSVDIPVCGPCSAAAYSAMEALAEPHPPSLPTR